MTPKAMTQQHSFSELSSAVLGQPLPIAETLDFLMREEFSPTASGVGTAPLWVGSVGYEHHKDCAEFARILREAGVERLIDVRELPISRRRGYAKTALGEAMQQEGIEYLHMRSLGNPKCYRDLYKSGKVDEGRAAYRHYLVSSQREALEELETRLEEKRSALMCVEHDHTVCHRTVIVEELRNELGLELDVDHIG